MPQYPLSGTTPNGPSRSGGEGLFAGRRKLDRVSGTWPPSPAGHLRSTRAAVHGIFRDSAGRQRVVLSAVAGRGWWAGRADPMTGTGRVDGRGLVRLVSL